MSSKRLQFLRREGPRFEVRIDEILGALVKWLRRCEDEGRDGTRLGACVKLWHCSLGRARSRPTLASERVWDRSPAIQLLKALQGGIWG